MTRSQFGRSFTSLNIKYSQIFLSMCFVSSVHGTLVLTQALASDYVCLKYSISQRAGRNKQNTHQEIVLQKLKSVGGSPRWSPGSASKLNKEPRSFIKQFKSSKNSRIWLQFNKQLGGIGESKACTMVYIAMYETFQISVGRVCRCYRYHQGTLSSFLCSCMWNQCDWPVAS